MALTFDIINIKCYAMSSALVLYWWSYVAQVCDTGSTTPVVLSVKAARIRMMFYVLLILCRLQFSF